MSQDYTITAVTGAKEWKGKHGEFVDYYCDLAEYDESVVLTQKPETADPGPGTQLYGHIEVQQRTKRNGEPFTVHKFKKDQRDDNGSGPPAHTPDHQTTGNAQPPARPADKQGEYFDAKGARIERQAAWKAAAVLTGSGEHYDNDAGDQRDRFEWWLDQLSADLDAYERSRRGLPAEETKPEPTLEDEVLAPDLKPDLAMADSDDIPF